jgi:hypothetical protein
VARRGIDVNDLYKRRRRYGRVRVRGFVPWLAGFAIYQWIAPLPLTGWHWLLEGVATLLHIRLAPSGLSSGGVAAELRRRLRPDDDPGMAACAKGDWDMTVSFSDRLWSTIAETTYAAIRDHPFLLGYTPAPSSATCPSTSPKIVTTSARSLEH